MTQFSNLGRYGKVLLYVAGVIWHFLASFPRWYDFDTDLNYPDK